MCDPDDLPEPDPPTLNEQLITYYRDQMQLHSDDPVLGACLICHRVRCADFLAAYHRLYAAGALEVTANAG